MVLPGLLAVLYAMRSLCTTYSKDDTDHDGILDAYPYRPNNVVMTTEFCKLCLATCLFFWHRAQYRAGRTSEPAKYLVSGPVLLKFSVPAFLYMCSNNLGFLALQYLDAPTFQVRACMVMPARSCALEQCAGSRGRGAGAWANVWIFHVGQGACAQRICAGRLHRAHHSRLWPLP
jgi:hypothetical protein